MRATAPRMGTRVLWALVLGLATAQLPAQAPARVARAGFPEGQAAIEHLLIQLDRDGADAAYPLLRDLAHALAPGVQVTAVVSTDSRVAGGQMLLEAAGFDPAHVSIVVAHAPVTLWARDRVVAVQGPLLELVTPCVESIGLDRAGDLECARILGSALPRATHHATRLWFEGGNILITKNRDLVGAEYLGMNSTLDEGAGDPVAELSDALGGDVMLVGHPTEMPHEHLDMFVTVIDGNTVLLGDPRLGAAFLREIEQLGLRGFVLPEFDDWAEEVQELQVPRYEAIAEQLTASGFRVERIPILHGSSGGMLTWNNALVELREDGRRAYVPTYGVPRLDEQALAVYRRVGCRVFPIDASRVAPFGGTVRCMVNVIGWRDVAPAAPHRDVSSDHRDLVPPAPSEPARPVPPRQSGAGAR